MSLYAPPRRLGSIITVYARDEIDIWATDVVVT